MKKGKTYPIELLTNGEAKRLICACSSRYPTGIRNRALLTVMLRAGLRISEALALKPRDLDVETGELVVLSGKGGKRRVVALDVGALAVVQLWIARRHELGINGRHRLFCTLKGGPVSSAYVRQLLPRLAGKAKILKRCHAHGLRHCFAAGLARDGVPVNQIQACLGHANLTVTSIYLSHVMPADVVKVLRRRKWEL